jgi:hypothetical protein
MEINVYLYKHSLAKTFRDGGVISLLKFAWHKMAKIAIKGAGCVSQCFPSRGA